MKNLKRISALILTVIAFSSCTKQDTPEPIFPQTKTQAVSSSYTFDGKWDCNDWVVDDITGKTHKRMIIFNQVSLSENYITLNDYNTPTSYNQLITKEGVQIDNNLFVHSSSLSNVNLKGVMTSDSTLMVYQYLNSLSGVVDTFQVKEFKRVK